MLSHFTLVQLFVTLWTVIRQAPPSMGFSRQEYWSGCHFFLQGKFLAQGLNLELLHWQTDSLPLHHLRRPFIYLFILILFYPFNKELYIKQPNDSDWICVWVMVNI